MILAIDCRVLDSSGIGVFLRECLLRFNSQDVSLLLIGSAEKIKKLSLKNTSILDVFAVTFVTLIVLSLFYKLFIIFYKIY